MPFVWSIGTIIGPAIGGTFADPHTSFPNTFSKHGLFGKFPYLLPNLLCASLLLISILAGYFLLEETHPDTQPCVSLSERTFMSEETPLIATTVIETPAVNQPAETYWSSNSRSDNTWQITKTETQTPRIFTKKVISLIIAMGIFTYHSMTYDHLLPIFLEDEHAPLLTTSSSSSAINKTLNPFASHGGLGLSLRTVGMIMSVNGAIALFIQAFIFPFCAEKLGTYRLFILVSMLHPIAYFIMPWLVNLPEHLLFPGIYVFLTIRNLLSILVYPVLLILIKEATPSPTVLGKINGLVAAAGAASRTVAPPVAGYLYMVGSRFDIMGLAWYGSGIVAIAGAIQCLTIERERRKDDIEDEASNHLRP